MQSQTAISKNDFEGAGFLLTYQTLFILAARIKKPEDLAKDPIEEVEYMGGKVEGTETPYKTAYNELVEECGGDPLDPGWESRVKIFHTFQPFTKKWIWCFHLDLTDSEFQKLVELDRAHDNWALGDEKDFSKITGRKQPARKAISGIAMVSKEDVLKYMTGFAAVERSKNRMADAKTYGKDENILFTCARISDPGTKYKRRLRGFNLVIFEEHLADFAKL